MSSLLQAALADNSLRLYQRAWRSLGEMGESLAVVITLPVPMQVVALFVAYLFNRGLSPKTISTYLSAISYVHKLQGQIDPTKGFLIQKLMSGAYRLAPSFDVRLPITEPLLVKLVHALEFSVRSHYDRKLFKSAFLFAFYAFSRVGEITTRSKEDRHLVIQMQDVSFHRDSQNKRGHRSHSSILNIIYRAKNMLCG